MFDVLTVKAIAMDGSGLIIDATKYGILDLKGIISNGEKNHSLVIIKNAHHLSPLDAKSIAAAHKDRVIFDLML